MPAPKGKKFPQRANKKGKLDTLDKLRGDKRSQIPIDTRREIVWEYMLDGNATRVAKNFCDRGINVSRQTIGRWMKTEWWQDMMKDAHDEYEDQIRGRMNKVIDKALRETEERLEKGDVFYDAKRGTTYELPVKAKDASMIAGINYDKRRVSLGLATTISGSSSTKQMEELANQFRDLAKNFQYKKVRDENAIEGESEEKTAS